MQTIHEQDVEAELEKDLASLARLASAEAFDDVRLYLARLVRKYRQTRPELAERLDTSLKATRVRSGAPAVLRRGELLAVGSPAPSALEGMPVDRESKLALLRVYDDTAGLAPPLLPPGLLKEVRAIVQERQERSRLLARGIPPTSSAILVGPPGVGKTLSARWIASLLGQPLWVLDLTAVMSSLLGKTGNNLRAALDYAKANAAVLLLDEIDAIAKRRSDESDVGELKRLVTVILQEVDHWPDTGLLLAATNHPELIDPALWRRFDAVLKFDQPDRPATAAAIERFLGGDADTFRRWLDVLSLALQGQSLSDVERALSRMRRGHALGTESVEELVRSLVENNPVVHGKAERLALALELARTGAYPHMEISKLTGVARDTIRKYAGPSPRQGRGLK